MKDIVKYSHGLVKSDRLQFPQIYSKHTLAQKEFSDEIAVYDYLHWII